MRSIIRVGASREIDLPDGGRFGATCDINFAADDRRLETDPAGFLESVKNACVVCRQAVEEELARQPPSSPGDDAGNSAAGQAAPSRLPPATAEAMPAGPTAAATARAAAEALRPDGSTGGGVRRIPSLRHGVSRGGSEGTAFCAS